MSAAAERLSAKSLTPRAKKFGRRFAHQLLLDGVKYSDAICVWRAILIREAVLGCNFNRAAAAESLAMDRKYLIDTFHSLCRSVFPEDVETEIVRLRKSKARKVN